MVAISLRVTALNTLTAHLRRLKQEHRRKGITLLTNYTTDSVLMFYRPKLSSPLPDPCVPAYHAPRKFCIRSAVSAVSAVRVIELCIVCSTTNHGGVSR